MANFVGLAHNRNAGKLGLDCMALKKDDCVCVLDDDMQQIYPKFDLSGTRILPSLLSQANFSLTILSLLNNISNRN